jgi:pyrimidine deaminase RibD-like protein
MDEHLKFMKLAVEECKRCPPDTDEIHPKVGAVIVKGDHVIKAFRNENGKGSHAEFLVFRKAKTQGVNVRGGSLYTTLEPCTYRNHEGKKSCAQHIMDNGIAHVFIGMIDNNPKISGGAIPILQQANVRVTVLPDFLGELRELNATFLAKKRQEKLS